MIQIQIKNNKAEIDNFVWKSSNKHIEKLLNTLSKNSELNSLSNPNPDLAEANRIIKIFGKSAKIIEKKENPKWKREKNRIY